MYPTALRLLRRVEAERAHGIVLGLARLSRAPVLGSLVERWWGAPPRPVSVFGLTFRNRIGLAAGFDKNAVAVAGLARLGFGHIEVGTVTPRPQPGNPKPRLHRLPDDLAVINRMGFPNDGATAIARRLIPRPQGVIVGVNIGKGADSPLEAAVDDYLSLVETFHPLADYLAVNVSSPNTPGLRRLQEQAHLTELLKTLRARTDELFVRHGTRRPLLVKLSPDLDDAGLDAALDAVLACRVDGVIATNTTLARHDLRTPGALPAGGLSGAPLAEAATAMVAKIHRRTGGNLPIIASGGVMGAADAAARLEAGASLVQVYTGLVYAGPRLVRELAAAG